MENLADMEVAIFPTAEGDGDPPTDGDAPADGVSGRAPPATPGGGQPTIIDSYEV